MKSQTSDKLTPGWLVKNARVLASLEVCRSRRRKAKGLLGLESLEGAVMLMDTKSVHTVGMRFDIDVAFVDENCRVIKIIHMSPNRVSPFVMKARACIEVEAGAFARWGVMVGDELEVRE